MRPSKKYTLTADCQINGHAGEYAVVKIVGRGGMALGTVCFQDVPRDIGPPMTAPGFAKPVRKKLRTSPRDTQVSAPKDFT